MRKRLTIALLAIFVLCLNLNSAQATDLIETSSFDISDDQNNPTLFNLTLGVNRMIASTGGGTGSATNGSDADFVGVTVPAGMSLDSITVVAYEHPFPTNRMFVAYESGSTSLQFPIMDYVNGYAPEPTNALFGINQLGSDVFTNLGSGPFAFWFQETNPEPATYELSFNVVPEPAGLGMLFSVFLTLVFWVRCR